MWIFSPLLQGSADLQSEIDSGNITVNIPAKSVYSEIIEVEIVDFEGTFALATGTVDTPVISGQSLIITLIYESTGSITHVPPGFTLIGSTTWGGVYTIDSYGKILDSTDVTIQNTWGFWLFRFDSDVAIGSITTLSDSSKLPIFAGTNAGSGKANPPSVDMTSSDYHTYLTISIMAGTGGSTFFAPSGFSEIALTSIAGALVETAYKNEISSSNDPGVNEDATGVWAALTFGYGPVNVEAKGFSPSVTLNDTDVVFKSVGSIADTITTVNFSGQQENDVVVVATFGQSGYATVTSSGYTLKKQYVFNGYSQIYVKQLGASPDSSIDLDCFTGETGGYVLWIVRGYSDVEDVAATTDAGVGSIPDNASITTTTDQAKIFAVGMSYEGVDVSLVYPPSGYIEALSGTSGYVQNFFGAIKTKETAGADNPAIWGITEQGQSFEGGNWDTITFALRPAAASSDTQVDPAAADLSIDGKQPTITRTTDIYVYPNHADIVIDGKTLTVLQNIIITPNTADLIIDGKQSSVVITVPSGRIDVSWAELSVPNISVISISPGFNDLVIDGKQATVTTTTDTYVYPDLADLTFSNVAPSVTRTTDTYVYPTTNDLTFSSVAPSVTRTTDTYVYPDLADLTFSSVAPSVTTTTDTYVYPGLVNLTFSSVAPSVTTTTDTYVYPTTNDLTFSSVAPSVTRTTDTYVYPGLVNLTVSSVAPSVTRTTDTYVYPDLADLTFSSVAPSVTTTTDTYVYPSLVNLTFSSVAPSVTRTTDTYVYPTTSNLTVTSEAPLAVVGLFVVPDASQLVIDGKQPIVTALDNRIIDVNRADIVISGSAPTVVATTDTYVYPTDDSLVIDGKQSTISVTTDNYLYPANDDIIIDGKQPTVSTTTHNFIYPDNLNLVVSGQTPEVTTTTGNSIFPDNSDLVISSSAPTVTKTNNHTIVLEQADVVLSSTVFDIVTTDNHNIVPSNDNIDVDGKQITVTTTTNNFVYVDAVTLQFTTSEPTIVVSNDNHVYPGKATLTITSSAPTILIDIIKTPERNELVITSYTPTITVTNHLTVSPSNDNIDFTSVAPTVLSGTTYIIEPGAAELFVQGHTVVPFTAPVIIPAGLNSRTMIAAQFRRSVFRKTR